LERTPILTSYMMDKMRPSFGWVAQQQVGVHE